MSLKFGKTIKTLWLSKNDIVLIKVESVGDKHAMQVMLPDSPQHGF